MGEKFQLCAFKERKKFFFFIIALQFQAYAKSTLTTLRSQLSQKGDGSERKF